MRIDKSRGMASYVTEMYEYRFVLNSLIVKNLVGRYKNSILGFGWHFVMPILLLVLYYTIFTQFRESNFDNFWLYLASGLFSFTFMVTNVVSGSGAVVSNAGLVKKMYFPREILVLSQVISTFFVALIGYLIVVITAMLTQNVSDPLLLLLLPVFLFINMLFVLGYTLLLSSLTVYCRDVQHLLSSISIVFYFITPMYFSTESIGGIMETVVWLNPFTYFVELFHHLIYFGDCPNLNLVMTVLIITVVMLIAGFYSFNKLKKGFAERL